MTKGKGRVGRRRGAPPAERRPRGHHPDRRSRRFGCSGAARSPEPPYHPPAPTRPPRRPLQLTVSPPVARRCVSGMVKPAAGGQLTPWMLVASSTTSASSTGRWAPPCPLHLPRRLARRTVARGARLAERRARHPVGPFPRLWAVRPRSLRGERACTLFLCVACTWCRAVCVPCRRPFNSVPSACRSARAAVGACCHCTFVSWCMILHPFPM